MTLDADVTATFTAEGAEPFTVDAGVSVDPGETLVILGPSGSGKTLLLESIAGFYPHEGRVVLDGRDLTDRDPEDRGFGFVFQDYALFPHMTVRENVEFGRRYRGETRDPDELLSELGIADLADRHPPTLSGGEAQRVALARALCVRPRLLLLDEPLSALDVPTRQSLRADLLSVLDGVTAVYVTHNRTTARVLADRIAVMRDGEIVQTGTPDEVFERPADAFVAEFTGSNVLPLDRTGLRGAFERADGHAALVVRPERVGIGADDPDLTATVEYVTPEDATSRVTLSVDGTTFDAFADRPPAPGESVGVAFDRDAVTFV